MQSAIKIHFEWNRVEIAELFCINKEKPASNCDGQCVLMKRLQKNNTEEKAPLSIPDNRSQNEWLVAETITIPSIKEAIRKTKYGFFQPVILECFSSIDVPPPRA